MKISYLLCYYFPEYVRTKTLLNGLQRIPDVQLYSYINKNTGWFRYIEFLFQLIRIKITINPDLYILGFRGYEVFWPVRLITWGKSLIIDHMMSPYDSLVHEKKAISQNSFLEKVVFRYERGILNAAEGILTDTPMHQAYFSNLFDVNPDKIFPVHVGTDEEIFHYIPQKYSEEFIIFFYGSFLPLHGVSYILQAAQLVRDLPIRFHLVGGHKLDLTAFRQQIRDLGLVNVIHSNWLDYELLPEAIANADLCLGGPFGGTGQAQRVITGKTYQFLAMKKPTIIGITEPDLGFVDKVNCLLVPQAAPGALAGAIRWAYDHPAELKNIAVGGRELFERKFSTTQISSELERVVFLYSSET